MPEKVFQLTPERKLKPCSFQDILASQEAPEAVPHASSIDIDCLDRQLLTDLFTSLELHPQRLRSAGK